MDTVDKAVAWDSVVKARAEGIAQGRADGFRAGAEAMRAAALAVIPEVNGAEIDDAIRALPIPESDNG